MARRPASKIVWTAALLGVLLIFASSLFAELRRERAERACQAGDLLACARRCQQHSSAACAVLDARCDGGEQAACAAKEARRRRSRW